MISLKSVGRGGVIACVFFILTALGAGAETATSPAAAGTRFDDKMLAAVKITPENTPANQHFTFVVFGDRTHTTFPANLPTADDPATKVLQEILKEADLLSPAFVLFVGDLIEGYDDPKVIQREWDEILPIVEAGKTPLVALVGNHDVQNQTTKQIWQTRVGDPYFSFDYGNTHFICLDSEEESEQGVAEPKGIISWEQLAWLKGDLEAHKKSANIFFFIHEPLFYREDYPKSNWEEVHSLLKKYPVVRAVFAGHRHEYRQFSPRDGIDYVITGGGGGELEGHPELGQFFHYLLVKVDGTKVSWSVIRPGSVLPPDVMTEALIQQFSEADKLIRVTPGISPEVSAAGSVTLSVAVRNPGKTEATMNISWELPNAAWQASPETAQLVVPAGEERPAAFTLQAKDAGWFAGPLPWVRVEIPILGGQQRLTVRKGIEAGDFVLSCAQARQPLTIDGNLSDWVGAQEIWLRPPFGSVDWTPVDASGLFRMMWDKQWLYLSAEIRDDIQVASATAADGSEDNVGFAFKKVPGGPDYYSIILVLVNGEGKILHNLRQPSGAWVPTPIPGAKVKIVRREGGRTFYEAALPRQELFPKPPAVGESFLTQFSWGDLDNDNAPLLVGWMETETKLK